MSYVNTPPSEKFEDVFIKLKEILDKKPSVNYEAEEYIKENFSLEKMTERYREYGLV